MSRSQARHIGSVAFDGSQIKALKGERSYEDVAREADVTLRTMQRWAAGTVEPRGSQLIRLAKALGVPADDLYVKRAA